MQVRARKMGFYEGLREVGDVFDVPDDLQASWFEPVANGVPAAKADDKPEKPKKEHGEKAANA